MLKLLDWLARNKVAVHLILLAVMLVLPVGLYWVAREGALIWIWLLLAGLALANAVTILTR